MGLKAVLKRSLRLTLFAILATAPLTFFPFIQAICAAYWFEKWNYEAIAQGTRYYLEEVEREQSLDYFSVPGAPSIWDHMDSSGPFQVPELRTSNWVSTLGFQQPFAQIAPDAIPINRLASLEELAKLKYSQNPVTEWWVYVSSLAMPDIFDWDAAFVRLLEYHNANPLPNSVGFAHVKCASSHFLCHIWQAEAPAFVHLIVDPEGELPYAFTAADYGADPDNLSPVSVQLIDLGLQESISPLTPNKFPSEFEQMRSLTTGNGAYSVADDYEFFSVFNKKALGRFGIMCNRRGSFLDFITNADNWIADTIAAPLGLKELLQDFSNLVFNLTFIPLGLIFIPWRFVLEIYQEIQNEELVSRIQEREAAGNPDMIHDMMDGFLDFVKREIRENETDSGNDGSQQPEHMDAFFANLTASMSSIRSGLSTITPAPTQSAN